MEEIYAESTYLLDLSNIEYIPEIIYKLSSVLENDDIKNKQICLKLGNVILNEAQLLSIKSLISGFDSSLVSLETKSEITKQTAASLGIKITDSEQNEQIIQKTETSDIRTDEQVQSEIPSENVKTAVSLEVDAARGSGTDLDDISSINKESTVKTTEDLQDELDVIFNSNSSISNIFQAETNEKYAPREELTDIVVPKEEYTKEDIEIETFPTKYIKQTIRSGQVINYEGNIIIIGDCHPGSEINASGDITVWGVLSGIAHAGSAGNEKARVRALKMNAIQLRIANCYSRRPDSLNSIFVEKTDSFTPEEARIINGEIVVFKIND